MLVCMCFSLETDFDVDFRHRLLLCLFSRGEDDGRDIDEEVTSELESMPAKNKGRIAIENGKNVCVCAVYKQSRFSV